MLQPSLHRLLQSLIIMSARLASLFSRSFGGKDPFQVYLGWWQNPISIGDFRDRRKFPLCPFTVPWNKLAKVKWDQSKTKQTNKNHKNILHTQIPSNCPQWPQDPKVAFCFCRGGRGVGSFERPLLTVRAVNGLNRKAAAGEVTLS